MPVYEYKCKGCAKEFELVRSLRAYSPSVTCECGKTAERHFSKPPAVFGDYAPYDCPITGKRIEGKKAHEANLRAHGCRVLEPGETDSYKRRLAAEDAAIDAAVEATAEQFVTSLPAAEQETLAKGLDAGLDVGFDRKTVN